MMHQAIPHGGLAYDPMLWIMNVKGAVWTVAIGFIDKISMQSKDIVFQVTFKSQNIKL